MEKTPEGQGRRSLQGLGMDQAHALTYLAEAAVLLGTLLVYRLAAQGGREELDGYVVVRRTISFLQPMATMGLAVGLPRMVAMGVDQARQRRYLRSATSVTAGVAAVLVLIAFAFPAAISSAVFGSTGYTDLVRPMSIMVLGLCLHAMAYSYLRGLQRMTAANVLQLVSLAIVPAAAFLVAGDLASVLWVTGGVWCVATLPVLVPEIIRASGTAGRGEQAELLRYGLPRIPGDLALAGLLTIPIYLVSYLHGLEAGGRLALGITFLNLIGAAFSPVSLLLLPKAAAQLQAKDHVGLESRIRHLEKWTLISVLLGTVLVELGMPWLLTIYLGAEVGADYVDVCRIFFIAAPPFAYFIALRSVLDAFHTTPRNGINVMLAFGVLVLACVPLYILGLGPIWMAAAVVGAIHFLAYRTWRDIRSVQNELIRLNTEKDQGLRILMVIPGKPEGNELPFSRRQGQAFARDHGATVSTFYLTDRMSVGGLIRSRRAFRTAIAETRPDVVHVHYGTVTALFTVLSSAVPVVVTFHGSDLNPTPSDGRLRDVMGRLFSQIAAFFAAGIICVSEPLRARLWWRGEEARILPMGADLNVFRPLDRLACRQELGWPNDRTVVLFNGNNPALKRLDLAQGAVGIAAKNGVELHLEVLTGAIVPARMPVLMNAADVLLLCSDREGSPTMVKEAMACGLPVVSNDVGDVRERVQGVTPGAVVAQDAHALATALCAVVREGGRSNGRERATTNGIDAERIDADTYAFLRTIAGR